MILDAAGTLKDERAVYASVRTDNKAHSNFHAGIAGSQNRIWSGQSFGRMGAFASGTYAGVRHIGEFGDMNGNSPKLLFACDKVPGAGNAQAWPEAGSHRCSREDEGQAKWPQFARKHVSHPTECSNSANSLRRSAN